MSVRFSTLWWFLSLWVVIDIVEALWRTAPHVKADLSRDAYVALFLGMVWVWARFIREPHA